MKGPIGPSALKKSCQGRVKNWSVPTPNPQPEAMDQPTGAVVRRRTAPANPAAQRHHLARVGLPNSQHSQRVGGRWRREEKRARLAHDWCVQGSGFRVPGSRSRSPKHGSTLTRLETMHLTHETIHPEHETRNSNHTPETQNTLPKHEIRYHTSGKFEITQICSDFC